jgi:hypothetical protein
MVSARRTSPAAPNEAARLRGLPAGCMVVLDMTKSPLWQNRGTTPDSLTGSCLRA